MSIWNNEYINESDLKDKSMAPANDNLNDSGQIISNFKMNSM